MVLNIILSFLLLLAGCFVVVVFLLFGMKFCKNCGELGAEPSWKEILLQLVKGYPVWLWTLTFLAFQPCIIHMLSVWNPNIWSTCDWIPNLSDFLGFIAMILYVIIFNISDDNGRLKSFHKSEGNSQKIPS